ncbi:MULTISPECIES: hypothetical protein [unclassified Ruegeria]|uniref:hypothetical protein n=1 Tax=unclassified Ruegeria TaxID=2625375 RepID=UPI0014888413|nr:MULTISPECIES: hypothetical protein [unclassified Ruegeria]
MVIVYLLSGPLVAVLCCVALILTGASTGVAVLGGLLIGCFTPFLVAVLHFTFSRKLRLKVFSKLPSKIGQ